MINRQIGGVKRIVKVAEIVVPFMAGAYILMTLIVIVLSITLFMLIFRSAFDMKPAFAGIFVMAVSWGVKRCIYSNEAGQGTAPHAAAEEAGHPVKQGLVQAALAWTIGDIGVGTMAWVNIIAISY